MKVFAIAVLFLMPVSAMAQTAQSAPGQTAKAAPVCTPPDELVIKLSFAKAVTLNNILQDVDVLHRDWIDVARDVRAQLVGQCKENKK